MICAKIERFLFFRYEFAIFIPLQHMAVYQSVNLFGSLFSSLRSFLLQRSNIRTTVVTLMRAKKLKLISSNLMRIAYILRQILVFSCLYLFLFFFCFFLQQFWTRSVFTCGCVCECVLAVLVYLSNFVYSFFHLRLHFIFHFTYVFSIQLLCIVCC